ncbi:hypothetical protein NPIL_477321 [Nephila pilipes]|uniref:Uncharacterized protein n=1 Tax=Nephila pilipes TaxID=299642 RepID=A0A8X6PWW4_NEPPI|nr:hypothetical protein NPIL_477321 [Nephila pilipes]
MARALLLGSETSPTTLASGVAEQKIHFLSLECIRASARKSRRDALVGSEQSDVLHCDQKKKNSKHVRPLHPNYSIASGFRKKNRTQKLKRVQKVTKASSLLMPFPSHFITSQTSERQRSTNGYKEVLHSSVGRGTRFGCVHRRCSRGHDRPWGSRQPSILKTNSSAVANRGLIFCLDPAANNARKKENNSQLDDGVLPKRSFYTKALLSWQNFVGV